MPREFCKSEVHHRVISPVMNLCKMFETSCPSPLKSSSLESSVLNKSDVSQAATMGSFSSPWLQVNTPSTSGRCQWDSGYESSLTPMASSTLMKVGVPRRASMRSCEIMPIPFMCDCEDDVQVGNLATLTKNEEIVPTTPSGKDESCCAVTTPLGHSMRSLNISQTPRRSIAQRRVAQKSVDKAHRIKLLTARERRAGGVQRPPLPKPYCDPTVPQWNVNIFASASTICSISPKLESFSMASCETDRFVKFLEPSAH